MSPMDRPSLSLWARDAIGDLKSAPNTFSSWDNCMAKAYCKWPVIVGIIIGAVILISVIACVINCVCCGIQCCTGCCRCLSCCCPSPRNKAPRSKYLDDPGYHQPAPMPANDPYRPPPGPPVYRGAQVSAQVARFDSPTSPPAAKVNEDALPAMPSWNDAVTRRVEDDSPQDAMEMEPLNPAHQDYQRGQSPGRFNSPGEMGVPPIRTQTSSPGYFHASSPYDEERQYNHGSSGPYNQHGSSRPYDQGTTSPYNQHGSSGPYNQGTTSPHDRTNDYSPRSFSRPMPRDQAPYSSQTQYSTMPTALSPSNEIPRHLPYRQPSPGMSSMPSPPSYTSYRGTSPNPPTSPPPPFSATNPVPLQVSDPGRPPSILQSGRKPVPNSYRDV